MSDIVVRYEHGNYNREAWLRVNEPSQFAPAIWMYQDTLSNRVTPPHIQTVSETLNGVQAVEYAKLLVAASIIAQEWAKDQGKEHMEFRVTPEKFTAGDLIGELALQHAMSRRS